MGIVRAFPPQVPSPARVYRGCLTSFVETCEIQIAVIRLINFAVQLVLSQAWLAKTRSLKLGHDIALSAQYTRCWLLLIKVSRLTPVTMGRDSDIDSASIVPPCCAPDGIAVTRRRQLDSLYQGSIE